MKKIAVFGGGAWGRALAFAFASKSGQDVSIISRKKIDNLPDNVKQVDVEQGKMADYIIVAIATFALREWLKNIDFKKDSKILFASKGIECDTGAFVSDIVKSQNIQNACFLCGPSFAVEVMASLPCALVVHSHICSVAKEFGDIFPEFIKTYASEDVIGGEVAGAYKNVIAIASGMCDGLHLGNNAKASLLARGLVEMSRFGLSFGAKMDTFLGLSGAGDLFLTSNSTMSRNYRVGLALSQGKKLEDILKDLGEVAEGVLTSQAIYNLARQNDIYTPIANEVALICKGEKSVRASLKNLMEKTK